MPKSRNILPPRVFWTPEQVAHLRQHYADTLTVELAPLYGRTIKQVLAKANVLGLHKSRELIAETARERSTRPDHGSHRTRIQPGQEPWNKGTHFVAGGRSAETRFKPGVRPHTWVPVGSYRVVEGQLQRKVNDLPGPNTVRWKPVSRLVWEEVHGPVPEGHKVVFKPGRASTDPAAIALDAVELVSDEELMRRNSFRASLPPEWQKLVQLRGVLTRTINRKTKEAA